MRTLLLFLLLLFSVVPAEARPGPGRGGGDPCPSGSPSPVGSVIMPQPLGTKSCILRDANGNAWQFQGAALFQNASNRGSFYQAFEIGASNRPYMKALCHDTTYIWVADGSPFFFPNLISPTQALVDGAIVKDGANGAGNLYSMMTSGNVHDGDTVTIQALPVGGTPPIWYMGSRYSYNNLTLSLAAGAAFGCAADEGNAAWTLDIGGGAKNGSVVTGAASTTAALGGSEIAYVRDAQNGNLRCINFASDNSWTLEHIFLHDCDFLVQAIAVNGPGTATITDVLFDHGGGGGPNSTSPTHNVYLGWGAGQTTSTFAVNATNVRSYCTNGTTAGAGFMFKTRWPSGTFSKVILAEPDPLFGYTDCAESAAFDLSCGGVYTVGGADAGTGAVLEVGPGLTLSSADGVIRYGADNPTGNCPIGGWPTSSLLVQNCWIINDSTKTTLTAIASQHFGSVPSMTIKNCKLVGLAGLGANVIDGGGNTFYANRMAAGLAPYPVLPSPP